MLHLKWLSRIANAFFLVLILRLFDSYHRKELVGGDVVEGKRNAEPEGCAKINRPAEELSGLGMLRGVRRCRTSLYAVASRCSWRLADEKASRDGFACRGDCGDRTRQQQGRGRGWD